MITNEKNTNPDYEMPLAQQVDFLRQSLVNFQVSTFEILKEKLGDNGIEIFKTILRPMYTQGVEMVKDLGFQETAHFIGFSDRVMGFQMGMDYLKPDEFQYSITYCPFLEECKRRGIDMEFCNVLEEVGLDESSKTLGKVEELTRMCWGDNKCTFKMSNTLGR
jgi:hypothetical protein